MIVPVPFVIVAVTVAVDVVALPDASAMRIIGWVVQVMRDWQPAAAVCTINWVGAPAIKAIVWVCVLVDGTVIV